MKGIVPLLAGVFAVASLAAGAVAPSSMMATMATVAGTGTIKGHVRLSGKLPGNSLIRMGVDPKCGAMNQGKQAVQEIVKASADGSLANVFVRLEGDFPKTPVPTTPVVINQTSCFYAPRVTGVLVGQTLQIKNNDALLHNVHSSSEKDNSFNVAQAKAGVVDSFKMKSEEVMMSLGCDVHRWMHAYVGVVKNPYFAVSDASGNYTIANVPAGTYTIDSWHEKYGPTKKTVTVTAGGTATVDFGYTEASK
jgi:plastocyanin